jgi:DNA-binding transcriptional LysR family regulator
MKPRPSLTELEVFSAIVRRGSFRAAADELGFSASTLSHVLRGLEERLGLRLLNRTTRSVAPTEAGARLYRSLNPILGELDTALADISQLGGRPSGQLRINASEAASRLLMRKIVPNFLARYPDVHLDLVTEGRFVDIVAEGFDAGVRLSGAVPQDMIAVPFGGDWRFAAVASPAYLAQNGRPETPDELARHRCIRFRMPSGKIYRWEFERHEQEAKLDLRGPLTLSNMDLMVQAAINGSGIAFVSYDVAEHAIRRGDLVAVLAEWTPSFPGHRLYYPSHRLVPGCLRAFVDVLKEVDGDSNRNGHGATMATKN